MVVHDYIPTMYYMAVCTWLLSTYYRQGSPMLYHMPTLPSLCVVGYCIVWTHHMLFICLSMDGHLGFLYFLPIMISAAMHIHVHWNSLKEEKKNFLF